MILREGLGFYRLSRQEQYAYRLILQAFSTMAVSINCTHIDHNVDLMKIIQIVLSDNPDVIYFDKTNVIIEKSPIKKHIILTGVYPKSQAEKMNLMLDANVKSIIAIFNNSMKDEYSMLIKLYELLQTSIRYDKEELQANTRGISNNPASHNAYGALINRKAVCNGFSSAFALLAQKLGFECMVIDGYSTYTAMAMQEHAWNIIKIKNNYFHIDVTWDSNKYNEFHELSYEYFALTDEEITSDHSWNRSTTPVCVNTDFSYYTRNGLYANNFQQLKEIIRLAVRKYLNVYRIKLSDNIELPKNTGDYLCQMVLDEAVKPGERKQASYSWNEKTKCFFAKIL